MDMEISFPSLTSLIGRNVRVYKGGPEARQGRLLAVKPDHIVIQTEKDGVLYYKIQHIKSIGEDAQDDTRIVVNNDYTEAENFHDLLVRMKFRTVKVDRGGPESRAGQVLSVHGDHVVLLTPEDGILYCKLEHVKSISDNSNFPILTFVEHPEYITGESFENVVDQLMYSRVKVNRGGPEAIEGVLVDQSESVLTLVVDKQVHHLPAFHVRNISVIVEKEEQKEENNEANAQKNEGKSKDGKGNKNNKEANQTNSILIEIRRELNQILAATEVQ